MGVDGVVARHVEPPVVHHVVEIDADAEAVRRFDEAQEVRLRAVAGGDRALLVLAAEIERDRTDRSPPTTPPPPLVGGGIQMES